MANVGHQTTRRKLGLPPTVFGSRETLPATQPTPQRVQTQVNQKTSWEESLVVRPLMLPPQPRPQFVTTPALNPSRPPQSPQKPTPTHSSPPSTVSRPQLALPHSSPPSTPLTLPHSPPRTQLQSPTPARSTPRSSAPFSPSPPAHRPQSSPFQPTSTPPTQRHQVRPPFPYNPVMKPERGELIRLESKVFGDL